MEGIYNKMVIVNARYCLLNGKVMTCCRSYTSIEYHEKELSITFTTPLWITNVHAYDIPKCVYLDDEKLNIKLVFNDFGIELVYKFTPSGYNKIKKAIDKRLKIVENDFIDSEKS